MTMRYINLLFTYVTYFCRYAVPINTTSCECKSSPGRARCVLWCTNAVRGFQIAKAKKSKSDTFGVFCPAGTHVS